MSKLYFSSAYLTIFILISFDIGDMGTPDFDQRGFILNIVLFLTLTLFLFVEKRKAKKEVSEE